jgi:hypothetical protein
MNIGNEIIVRPLTEKNPEDALLEFLAKVKLTNEDWEEIQKERDER